MRRIQGRLRTCRGINSMAAPSFTGGAEHGECPLRWPQTVAPPWTHGPQPGRPARGRRLSGSQPGRLGVSSLFLTGAAVPRRPPAWVAIGMNQATAGAWARCPCRPGTCGCRPARTKAPSRDGWPGRRHRPRPGSRPLFRPRHSSWRITVQSRKSHDRRGIHFPLHQRRRPDH